VTSWKTYIKIFIAFSDHHAHPHLSTPNKTLITPISSTTTRTPTTNNNNKDNDWTTKQSEWKSGIQDSFSNTFSHLVQESEIAQKAVQAALDAHPAAVQPLTLEAIQQHASGDLFILDNSLRETTVGQARGHTLKEEQKIVAAMAERLDSKRSSWVPLAVRLSVDSQIVEQWKFLGKSFDQTRGFTDAYDFEAIDEDPLWVSNDSFDKPKGSYRDCQKV
jgi:hypothetical protein